MLDSRRIQTYKNDDENVGGGVRCVSEISEVKEIFGRSSRREEYTCSSKDGLALQTMVKETNSNRNIVYIAPH